MASRAESCKRVRALSDDCFAVCAVNAPFILGSRTGPAGSPTWCHQGLCHDPDSRGPRSSPANQPITSRCSRSRRRCGGALGWAGPARPTSSAMQATVGRSTWSPGPGGLWRPREYEVRGDIDHPLIPFAIMYAGIRVPVSYQVDRGQVLLGYGSGTDGEGRSAPAPSTTEQRPKWRECIAGATGNRGGDLSQPNLSSPCRYPGTPWAGQFALAVDLVGDDHFDIGLPDPPSGWSW